MNSLDTLARTKNWKIPTVCPFCGHSLELNENHTKLFCPNEGCKTHLSGRINKWTLALKIKELGLTTIDKFVNEGIFTSLSSLYNLDYNKIASLEGFGEKSANAIRKEIEKHSNIKLSQFFAGLNVAGIGEKQIVKMIEGNKKLTSVDAFLAAKASDFVTDGIGEITANKFFEGIHQLEDEISALSKCNNLKIEQAEDKPAGNKLEGMSFCFTGKACMPRPKLEEMVKLNGGKIAGVTKKLSYLVTDDTSSGSSKNKKAAELGVAVITSEEFLSLLK